MRCVNGNRFIEQTRVPNQLEVSLNEVILDVKALLFPNALKVNPSRQYTLNVGKGIGISIPASRRIYEVQKSIWPNSFPNWRNARGLYQPSFGKIFLHEDKWCRETLIHEALHSLSAFNVRTDLCRYLFLRDGITEFLTGYILFRKYPRCYQAWNHERYPECKVTYKRQVRSWCAFCNFVSIKEVVRIYFWDRSTPWQQCYSLFLDAIHNAGFPDFRDVFSLEPTPTLEEVFVEECAGIFGQGFTDVFESRLLSLDYTRILP